VKFRGRGRCGRGSNFCYRMQGGLFRWRERSKSDNEAGRRNNAGSEQLHRMVAAWNTDSMPMLAHRSGRWTANMRRDTLNASCFARRSCQRRHKHKREHGSGNNGSHGGEDSHSLILTRLISCTRFATQWMAISPLPPARGLFFFSRNESGIMRMHAAQRR